MFLLLKRLACEALLQLNDQVRRWRASQIVFLRGKRYLDPLWSPDSQEEVLADMV